MLGFVDESGDTGFRFDRNSSPYFVVALVLVPNEEEAQRIGRTIEDLKAEMRKPSMEFHFAKTDDRTRQKFFTAVGEHDFRVIASACNKSSAQSLKDNHAGLLLAAFGATLEHARDRGLLDACSVKYDESGSNAFQRKLSSSLLAQVNGLDTGRFLKRCEPQRSAGNNLIQLVDMVCGAIARPYNKPDRESRDLLKIIKHRVYPVHEWP